jgi:hypothetical protein
MSTMNCLKIIHSGRFKDCTCLCTCYFRNWEKFGNREGHFLSRRHPLHELRSQQELNVLYNNGLRMRFLCGLRSQYGQAARTCATVQCATLYRQAYGHVLLFSAPLCIGRHTDRYSLPIVPNFPHISQITYTALWLGL